MITEEAIKTAIHCLGVQAEHEVCEECPVYLDGEIACREAARVAIEALKEVRQYREIGTVEECQEAREKQIPKKPVCKPKPYNESVGFNEEWFCPSCGAYIGYFYEGMDEPEQMEYCNECGQHIARDWSDENVNLEGMEDE